MTSRAAIYCRISKKNKNIPKVENQEAMLRELASREGYEVMRVYVDDGISALNGDDRPGWDDLLRDIQDGQFDVLLAQSEDRFTRQVMAKETLMLLCSSKGVTWHTINDGKTDPSTDDGQFFSTLRSAMDRKESKRKAARQRQANDSARAKGEPATGGTRIFGYLEDKVTPHPIEGPLIKQAYEDFLGGETLSKIRTEWNEANHLPHSGAPWTHAKIRQVLVRPRNAGLVQHRRKIMPGVVGTWTPLVDEETYNQTILLMEARSASMGRKVEQKWLCSSVALCGSCGRKMRLAIRNNGPAYRCSIHEAGSVSATGVRHTSIGAELLDEAVTEAVVDAVLFAPTAGISNVDEATLRELNVRLSALKLAQLNLLELVESGAFDANEVVAKRAKLRAEQQGVETKMAAITEGNIRASLITQSRSALWAGKTVSFQGAAKAKADIREKFNLLTLDQKRALIDGMLAVVVINGRGPKRIKIEHLAATGLNAD